jgi:hypothetical protein
MLITFCADFVSGKNMSPQNTKSMALGAHHGQPGSMADNWASSRGFRIDGGQLVMCGQEFGICGKQLGFSGGHLGISGDSTVSYKFMNI